MRAAAWTADGGHVVQRLQGRCTGRWVRIEWPLHHRAQGRQAGGGAQFVAVAAPLEQETQGGRPGRVLGRSPTCNTLWRDGVGSQRLSPLPFSRNLQDPLLMVVLPPWRCSASGCAACAF